MFQNGQKVVYIPESGGAFPALVAEICSAGVYKIQLEALGEIVEDVPERELREWV